MCASLQRRSSADGPTTVGFAALVAVLAGLVLVRLGVGYVAGTLPSVTGLLRVPLLVTLAYSAVALAGLGAVYAAFAAGREERLDRDELAQAGLAAVPLVAVAVYVAFDRLDLGVSALPVVRSAGYLAAVGLLAAGYARAADLDIPTMPPTRDGWTVMGLAVVAVVVSVVLATVGATFVGWPDVPFAAFRYGAAPSVPSLLLTTAVPGTITAAGTALLFNGAVQTALGRYRSPAAAAGAVTLLAFGADWAITAVPVALSPVLDPVPVSVRWLVVLAALMLAIVAVLAASLAYGRFWDERDLVSGRGRSTLAAAGAAAALGAVVAVVGFALLGAGFGPAAVSYAVAVGVAAVAFERARTVWAPAVVYAVHGVAVQIAPYYVLPDSAADIGVTVLSALG
ncbi:hypothetical protein [Halosimplex pelagicum]|uniref:Uncharacterized protein n=1 Tax=Halosimplex pelagicum TaxID=869886 RepID=A0A7D5PAQ5_9EURY|nr:hypothetical protein [Halosimplex pelagicum]QLH83104.1 hypothetical protein HZS54_16380 [Halosimplex pelagicum]